MSEEDDRVRRGIQHLFSPDWANNLGAKAGQALREKMSDPMREQATNMAKRYVAWVEQQRANPLPNPLQAPAQKAVDWYNDGAHPNAKQDAELELLRLQKEAAQKQLAEQAPRDGGDIDAPDPNVRQPIQMQREFSNDPDKEAYLERIRQAQKNAAASK
jgi:hypothetical protein